MKSTTILLGFILALAIVCGGALALGFSINNDLVIANNEINTLNSKVIDLQTEVVAKNVELEVGNKINALWNQKLKENEEQIKDISLVAIKCYWATEYWTDYEGTLNHFNGNDYSAKYYSECMTYADLYWDEFSKVE